VQDYPPPIQARHGPKSERGRRVASVMGAVMAVLVLAVAVAAPLHLAILEAGEAGFWFGVSFMVALTLIDGHAFDDAGLHQPPYLPERKSDS
jgi:hypothetical protein